MDDKISALLETPACLDLRVEPVKSTDPKGLARLVQSSSPLVAPRLRSPLTRSPDKTVVFSISSSNRISSSRTETGLSLPSPTERQSLMLKPIRNLHFSVT